jgi:hypothetical protein
MTTCVQFCSSCWARRCRKRLYKQPLELAFVESAFASLAMAEAVHVCERRVSPLMPSKPRLILLHLQQFQDQWNNSHLNDAPRKADEISCICIQRLGRRFGDTRALQLAQALLSLPSVNRLQVLQLCHNEIGDTGFESLFNSVKSPFPLQLRVLALCHNKICMLLHFKLIFVVIIRARRRRLQPFSACFTALPLASQSFAAQLPDCLFGRERFGRRLELSQACFHALHFRHVHTAQ